MQNKCMELSGKIAQDAVRDKKNHDFMYGHT